MIETGTLTAAGAFASDIATDVTVIVAGSLALSKSVAPAVDQMPGSVLTYTTDYQNIGTDTLTTVVILDAIPAFTPFEVNSELQGTPPASVTGVVASFSNDGGLTWVYSPSSGGGGAPAGYDANVTNVRFVMTGTVDPGGAAAIGVSFAVRIIAE
jgi:uncharacterized repeat protein (TIGR01451 family)